MEGSDAGKCRCGSTQSKHKVHTVLARKMGVFRVTSIQPATLTDRLLAAPGSPP